MVDLFVGGGLPTFLLAVLLWGIIAALIGIFARNPLKHPRPIQKGTPNDPQMEESVDRMFEKALNEHLPPERRRYVQPKAYYENREYLKDA